MTRARPRLLLLVLALALAATALPLGAQAAPITPVQSAAFCDPIDPAACLLPFPNDFFTVPDESTATGLRINFTPDAMPRTGTEATEGGEGKPVDPTEWNRNDGFSPGSLIMTYVPGLDLHQTWGTTGRDFSDAGVNELGYFDHRDHIADIGLYKQEGAPLVIIDEDGERHPFWSELDSHPGAVDAEEQLLLMRPAVNFEEGERYIVALRNLKDSSGAVIEAGDGFAAIRDGEDPLPLPGAEARRDHFESDIFPVLEEAGIARDDLYLAWDFTVASTRNLSERMLHMRDQSFRALGDENLEDRRVEGSSPDFVIDDVTTRGEEWRDSRGTQFNETWRVVEGRVTVPNYMDRIQQTEGHFRQNELPFDFPAPGSRLLDLDLNGLPDQNPVESEVEVPFICEVPLDRDEKLFGVQYGHGLLGERKSQVDDARSPLRYGPFYSCAIDWWGMSTPDIVTVATILVDVSNFPSLPDRGQQGFLNWTILGRAMVHPDGFASESAFQADDGQPLIWTPPNEQTPAKLFYDGNSQGGIMGGSLVAVSPDVHRGILGVPGMNYSTLLNRSVDWEGSFDEMLADPEGAADDIQDADVPFRYAAPFYASYTDPIERQIVFSMMQMLWDRAEANGYAAHMTDDPLPNTPKHEVMLQVAFSDHQVANVSAEVEARTIGAPVMEGLASGRHWALDPFITISEYPYEGSALIYWDSGNATPPNGNLPPSQNGDPHGHPRSEPAAGWQEAQFLLTGWMVDVCAGDYITDNNPINGGTPSCHEPLWPAGTYETPPFPAE